MSLWDARARGGLCVCMALISCALAACTQPADVVAHRVPVDAGGPMDATARDASSACNDLYARLSHTLFGKEAGYALLQGRCSVPVPPWLSKSMDGGVSPSDLARLFSIGLPSPDAGVAMGCDANGLGFRWKPGDSQVFLCPANCSSGHYTVVRTLAQDGCDTPYDAGTAADFPFMFPPQTMPGKKDAAVADDAAAPNDAG